ncbi:MAG: hypothetical protein AAF600_20800 [Bacteroidota bacterium]
MHEEISPLRVVHSKNWVENEEKSVLHGNPLRFIDPDGMMGQDVVDGPCGSQPCPKEQQQQQIQQQEQEPQTNQDPGILDNLGIGLEINVTVGVQAGVEIGNIVEADLNIVNVEIAKDELKLEDGKVTSTKKLGTMEMKDGESTFGGKMKVENSAGLKVLGFGGKIGQTQEVNSSGNSNNYNTYTETGGGYGGFGSSIKEETNKAGQTKTSQESSFSIGASFILGVELKFSIKQ